MADFEMGKVEKEGLNPETKGVKDGLNSARQFNLEELRGVLSRNGNRDDVSIQLGLHIVIDEGAPHCTKPNGKPPFDPGLKPDFKPTFSDKPVIKDIDTDGIKNGIKNGIKDGAELGIKYGIKNNAVGVKDGIESGIKQK